MKKSVIDLQQTIADCVARIGKIQDKCPHKTAVKKHGASTGNYDPSQDSYWTDLHCPECGKRWTVCGSV